MVLATLCVSLCISRVLCGITSIWHFTRVQSFKNPLRFNSVMPARQKAPISARNAKIKAAGARIPEPELNFGVNAPEIVQVNMDEAYAEEIQADDVVVQERKRKAALNKVCFRGLASAPQVLAHIM